MTTEPPKKRRRWRRIIALVVALPILVVGIWVATHWTFTRRLATYPFSQPVTRVDWYEPLDEIAGDHRAALATVDPNAVGLDSAALAQATQWADERNSSVLLVLYRGQVVLERYFRGAGPTTATTSFSMAKTLVALLLGTAIERGEIRSIDDPIGRYVSKWREQRRILGRYCQTTSLRRPLARLGRGSRG